RSLAAVVGDGDAERAVGERHQHPAVGDAARVEVLLLDAYGDDETMFHLLRVERAEGSEEVAAPLDARESFGNAAGLFHVRLLSRGDRCDLFRAPAPLDARARGPTGRARGSGDRWSSPRRSACRSAGR